MEYDNYPADSGVLSEDDLRSEAGQIVIDYVRDCIAAVSADEMATAYSTVAVTPDLVALVDSVILEMTVRWNE